jgi:feruloyl esterase
VRSLVARYYGRKSSQSYFSGCSTGGDQAMEEAEYFPQDFDGIIANSPGMAYGRLMVSFLWGRRAATHFPDSRLSGAKLQMLHQAVLSACDDLDGVRDGVIEDPRQCKFDPAALSCKGDDAANCLNPHQVTTVREMLAGPHNLRTGEEIYPGFAWGSEASAEYPDAAGQRRIGWGGIQGPLADLFATPLLANVVFRNPNWTAGEFDFDSGVARVDHVFNGVITATEPDLRAFQKHGGKLIITQGWADPLNAQTYPIEYLERVEHFMAADADRTHDPTAQVGSFFRLFMAPGMGHCGSGPGPNRFDAVAALDTWVVRHDPPTKIVASKHVNDDPDQPVVRTRPLCPFPTTAHWTGQGLTDVAANFTCDSTAAH